MYVKVIFLHVDCRYFVFRNTLYQFFVKKMKSNSVCVEIVSHWKCSEDKSFKSFFNIMFIFLETFWRDRGRLEIKKVYNVCFMLHAHDIAIFNCIFEENV